MEPDEPYHLAWERFQTLLSRCSQHGLSDWALVENFYNGLTPECKARFDTFAGGHLMGKKTVAECNDLFESFAHADIDHSATSRNSTPMTTSSSSRGVNQVVSDSKLGEVSNISLSGGCSAVVLNKVPEKLTDPGLFTIPCLFGSDTECRALADLGAGINLMPYSMYERLGLGELSPTRMSLSLADRSVKYPRGIIENLLVKVDKFVFPINFVVLDMEADEKVPIILGRPFLCTVKAIIDVFDGKITLQVVEGKLDEVVAKVEEVVSESEEVEETEWVPEVLELSEVKSEFESTPLEKPAPLELKILPSHLEYAFLGEGSDFPVIISSKLEEGEKGRLLEVLRENKEAIAWRISDIKGISPAYCTHRILMEDDYKPMVQPQWRLNPNMQEVVKKEVLSC
ncbi:uncharacterized protein LOC110888158 [Helianthus annuus]|uniref:uncharacterized protein LOC110888158 n=1 Tax=Helianthus annuus TaxID=4232 RepID=UPI000B8FCEB4|nr:uncharacterized protein LOC110888158 [Helianthus annuus]